jgi:phosphatidylserine decarboxylase
MAAKSIKEWVHEDLIMVKEKSVKWLSENYFFRDPLRPNYIDHKYFFSPADGIILYQKVVQQDEGILDIKGKQYTISEAIREKDIDGSFLVIGIFMTLYDVHINRIPYPGRLSYRELDPLCCTNYPMLDVEKGLLENFHFESKNAVYLHYNQRMLNKIFSPELNLCYYILQIADYDVDSILPFELKQNRYFFQNQRFSQIRYGSQVDLIIPITKKFEFKTLQSIEHHVEAGIDPIIKILG